MENRPIMKCGHSASGTTIEGKPYCVICNCDELAEMKPDLTGRQAKCCFCGETVESNEQLPFFEYRAKKDYDLYYCGCEGWD